MLNLTKAVTLAASVSLYALMPAATAFLIFSPDVALAEGGGGGGGGGDGGGDGGGADGGDDGDDGDDGDADSDGDNTSEE